MEAACEGCEHLKERTILQVARISRRLRLNVIQVAVDIVHREHFSICLRGLSALENGVFSESKVMSVQDCRI